MNEKLAKYYELLGVAPGTSGRELKQAYHDLAKVWHPDRFSHDPRLQQKAQEKLKEINDAYEQLKSGRAAPPIPPPGNSYEPPAYEPPAAPVRRRRPQFMLLTIAGFCAAFVAALITLAPSLTRRAPPQTSTQTPTAKREEARPLKEEAQSASSEASPSTNQSKRGNERSERTARRPPEEAASGGAPAAGPSSQPLRPMPTVTVTVDAITGLLATEDCPTVNRMTYPAGDEPKRYCTTQHRTKVSVQAEPPRPKDSRVKSVAKRLTSPSKWFGGSKEKTGDEARDVQQSGNERPQNR